MRRRAAPDATALGGQWGTVRDVVVWELAHAGSGFVTATNSVGDNELGLRSRVCKMKKQDSKGT